MEALIAWKMLLICSVSAKKLANSGLPAMEILVYKEGSQDLNMCKLALMVFFCNFNDLTDNSNLETILSIRG